MGRSLRIDEVRGFEYQELTRKQVRAGREWNMIVSSDDGVVRTDQTPVAPCARCGGLAEDPTRDAYGLPMPEHGFLSEEEKTPVCSACTSEAFGRALEGEMLQLFENKLGLAEKHRDALRSFIETIFTDPAKILQVQDLDNRVDDLEKQNGRLWLGLSIALGLVAISIAGVVAIALALAS